MVLAAPFPGVGAAGLHQAPSEGRLGTPFASALAKSVIRIGLSSALLARPRVTPLHDTDVTTKTSAAGFLFRSPEKLLIFDKIRQNASEKKIKSILCTGKYLSGW